MDHHSSNESPALDAEILAGIDLSGTWQVRLDPDNHGLAEHWWSMDYEHRLVLPGSLTAQGYGEKVNIRTPWVGDGRAEVYSDPRYSPYKADDNFKYPFWLQPNRYYRGAAWYRREIRIPTGWEGKRILLSMERTHWITRVWIDQYEVGAHDSLSTPHEYDLTAFAACGTHTLTVRVDNSIALNVGVNSHSVSDHTQGNWNGIVGKIRLRATENEWIEDVQVYPDIHNRSARIRISMVNASGGPTRGKLEIRITPSAGQASTPTILEYQMEGERQTEDFTLPLGQDIQLWDEFNPALYRLSIKQVSDNGKHHRVDTRFGMREVSTKGTQITVNGRPVFLRGTLECAIFPKTGYPPTDVDAWKNIVQTCKDYGLNHIRFHSWCPPEAAFIAADELGVYLQVECPSWANQGVTVGDGDPLDEWLYAEGRRITKAYGNHPSFLTMAQGNEPAGDNQKEYLSQWCTYWKTHEPRILHTSAAGWPMIETSDYHSTWEQVRIQEWGQELRSIINALPPQTQFDFSEHLKKYPEKPTVSHEIGQWCVFPDIEEIKKYTGLLKPRNFEVFRDFLQTAHMADQAHEFLMASGKLQALCYKHDIEASLRTRGFGGFQMLDLHDFPGQGTALVGILNAFWESKGYITPEEHTRYCAPTVPLARMRKMVWTADETFQAEVEVAHFGPADLTDAEVRWSLRTPEAEFIAEGVFPRRTLLTGRNTALGTIHASFAAIRHATKVVFEIGISGTGATNSWDLWCYPSAPIPVVPPSVNLLTRLDDSAAQILQEGGTVILTIAPETVKTDVKIGFSSIFWNTAWTDGQAPHTLGVLCYPEHPALQGFPTDYHSNWQWWDLVAHSATMEMDAFPTSLRPIVQVVPDWFKPKRLGLVFEARVGNGRILVTSINLTDNLDQRPVARQMLNSLTRYAASPTFQPSEELTIAQIRSLFN